MVYSWEFERSITTWQKAILPYTILKKTLESVFEYISLRVMNISMMYTSGVIARTHTHTHIN